LTRAVLDTNTIVSGIGWRGPPRVILDAAIRGDFILLTSLALIDEVRRVLAYPRLRTLPQARVQEVLALLPLIAYIVEPKEKLTVIRQDPTDNRILECALAGDANHIISGDEHLLALKTFHGIPIMAATDFVRLLRKLS